MTFSQRAVRLSAALPHLFFKLNHVATEHFYDVERWQGFRVLAVDGVKLHLSNDEVIHPASGGQGHRQADEHPMALGSALYGVFQKIMILVRRLKKS